MDREKELKKEIEKSGKAAGVESKDLAPVRAGEVLWEVSTRSKFVIEHAIIPQNEELSKIVFHIKEIAPSVANDLSMFLHEEITKNMKPPPLVEAFKSPLFTNQWDLMLYHLPNFRAPMIRDALLCAMDRFLAR